uniref:Uncharacterized protein n=1 Tax=Vitrella brassicaformis TaxID=1169539 RepID=A0A7S1P3W8_9ALVE|mmetsp:Transcript_26182/g.65097  ORF Transcript_26182/g.65097 Transcript_26182/m.65097 type:complete len:244 (+) Transcript_26182:88-819(+)
MRSSPASCTSELTKLLEANKADGQQAADLEAVMESILTDDAAFSSFAWETSIGQQGPAVCDLLAYWLEGTVARSHYPPADTDTPAEAETTSQGKAASSVLTSMVELMAIGAFPLALWAYLSHTIAQRVRHGWTTRAAHQDAAAQGLERLLLALANHPQAACDHHHPPVCRGLSVYPSPETMASPYHHPTTGGPHPHKHTHNVPTSQPPACSLASPTHPLTHPPTASLHPLGSHTSPYHSSLDQ